MPKSREIQRGEGFESSTVYKPNAALEAFEELVEAAEKALPLAEARAEEYDSYEEVDTLRQALTRAGEIRKALAHQDAAFLKAADNLRDCYADATKWAGHGTMPSIRQYDEARAKIGREGK